MATKTLSNQQPTKQIHLRPTIKVPPAKVIIDPGDAPKALEVAVVKMTELMSQIAQANAVIAQRQTEILNRLAQIKEPKITVQAPAKARDGGRDFYVELDKEDGEIVGMRVTSVQSD